MSTEKRALIATALSILVLVVWSYFFAPQPPARNPQTAPSPAAGTAAPGAPAAPGSPPPASDAAAAGREHAAPPSPPAAAVADERERIMLVESRTARVKLTNVGARVVSWRLLRYFDDEGNALELVPDQGGRPEALPLELVVPGDEALTQRLNQALYACAGPKTSAAGAEISCRWSDGRSLEVEKTLTLPADGYLASLRVRVTAPGAVRPLVAWAPGLIRDEGPAGYGQPAREARLVLAHDGKVERLPAAKAGAWQPAAAPMRWAGVEEHYFAAVFVPDGAPGRFSLFGRARDAQRPLALGVAWEPGQEGAAHLFIGPKSYDVLHAIDVEHDLGLQRLVDYGYFWWIAVPLFSALKWLHRYLHSYGLAIIALTIGIKLVFYPITQRSMVSMRRLQTQMKRLQPRLQHIRDQYARKPKSIDSRARMNQEIMELYKRENVNPMASMTGCLPLLLQIPILWAFYSLLSAAIELRRAPFLYLSDLSGPDPYHITPIVMGATMWLQQRLSGTATPDPAQRWMLNLMPVMMTAMFWSFPSGLVLYWLVNNLLGIGQQFLINRQAEAAEALAAGGKPAPRRS
jgi:YidC/Oxa1 family membrane protein insertase